MQDSEHRAIAIVGVGALLPDARNAPAFWENIKSATYSISEVPVERWDPELYWDPDPRAPDKTYSKIGGWVLDWEWQPLEWHLPIPPRVSDAMDRTQKWAIIGCREALADYGYPERSLDPERTAVILGNAMAGDLHYQTALRISFPEYARELALSPSFGSLPQAQREAITAEFAQRMGELLPGISEDSMPGELANIIAGRVASLFDFHGPNYVVDAACASAMAALNAAIEGLVQEDYDAVLTGGIDANMSAATFTKFCKIGALSATGTRPYAEGADGFVMGEGAALFLLKRLTDAERDGDAIYAVIRGLGGSSDGRGKGITAPNPVGQRLAVERAWQNAGVAPGRGTLIEGHGTSTKVGDVAEVESLAAGLGGYGLERGSVPLGSVKSNIGHLKGAAGAAGLLKAALALRDKVLPPSLNFDRPNPHIDFANCPFYVNTELEPWEVEPGTVRQVGVSAFGFGGTNFHTVLEEHVPGRIRSARRPAVAVAAAPVASDVASKSPLRGALLVGASDEEELVERLRRVLEEAEAGRAARASAPAAADLQAEVRLAIDYQTAAELAAKAAKAIKALTTGRSGMWRPLNAQGVFLGRGAAPRVAFLYTGQGSQYLNMLRQLREVEPIVAETFEEADAVMAPLLGKPLTDFLFIDDPEGERRVRAEEELRQTAITQPAVLTTDIALTRLLAAYGVTPDFAMGHSLGEYGALVAAGALPFGEALEAVSARGKEMTRITDGDNGSMAAVIGPLADVERIVEETEGYVVVANYNSPRQSVIGGATEAVERAVAACKAAGHQTQLLRVSHAFHTDIVAPASEPLAGILGRLHLQPPRIPIVSNVTGELYPMGADVVPEIIRILARQVFSPVQFVKGLETLYQEGARVFVEVGPKKALHGMVRDVLRDREEVLALFTNNPKTGEIVSLSQALCGLYAAGLGTAISAQPQAEEPVLRLREPQPEVGMRQPRPPAPQSPPPVNEEFDLQPSLRAERSRRLSAGYYRELGELFAGFLEQGFEVYSRRALSSERGTPVVITGASLGLPGTERVFDDGNIERLLRGDQFITPVPEGFRKAMVDKNIVRLVKSERGEPRFETIGGSDEVIRLAARGGKLDLVEEFGYPADRLPALDVVTELAIGSGLDALRDAGIPLVMRYKTTSKGTQLPERWGLPDELRDDTGVIFASAFPGVDFMAAESERYYTDVARRRLLGELQDLRRALAAAEGSPQALSEVEGRIAAVSRELEADPYTFERRFLFKLLSMGHSQFAELIGARGPNTQINAACATSTQAVGLAEDWIRSGRCRRVVIISADNVTSDHLLEWIGAGFLATGAAATDERVEEAAVPFDRRRHGMLIGMGAAAIVVESLGAAEERGIQPICEVLATAIANSAFHGTRLDVDHITQVMERLMRQAEERWSIDRYEMAPQTVFISHETYTPARGGSAQAEVYALRDVFGPAADKVLIANTKGYTGHPMAVGIEDVLAIKTLETGWVPPVANFKEVDPDLGNLNLSAGGAYPVRYALRLGAGFGSQISLSLLRWVPPADGEHRAPRELGYAYRITDPAIWQGWLARVSGQEEAETEVVRRTLRVKDQGAPARRPRPVVAESPPAESAPPPAPSAVEEPTAPPAPARDPVEKRVLEIVAETTGYPPEMLDLDLDMEADLGIDTVKQAETFSAIREEWGIPRDDELQLRDFPTLAHAIQFVYDRRPELEVVAPAPSPGERPPAASPAPSAVEEPTAPPAPARDPVEKRVLEIVAETTGYPPEMLDLDLDMEADLGIDTVKQAETFSAIREEWGIPRDDELQLRDFPTLAHAIQFVYDRRPELKARGPMPAAGAAAPELEAPPAEELIESPRTPGLIPRRVPWPVLRPELERCRATRSGLGRGNRVVVMPDNGGIGEALVEQLQKIGVETLVIDPTLDADELRRRLERWRQEGAIKGVYWLPALDDEGSLEELSVAEWREAVDRRVKRLYTTLRELYEEIGRPGTFLVVATRLGGQHGYHAEGAQAPLGGGVVGLAKAFKRERSEALVKAVDFGPSRTTTVLAKLLIAETLRDPGVVEVGYKGGRRWTVGLVEEPLPKEPSGRKLGKDSVFVVTGAAGSIVSAIVGDLAVASGGTFFLLDLVPEPDPSNPDLELLSRDPESLKRQIFERLKAAGERATPARIEKELASLERAKAALAGIHAVEKAGGKACYLSVDLRDAEAVERAIDEVRRQHGRIDVLLHAAGLEISHMLPDKEPSEFELVFDVKSSGWFHLMKAIGEMPLGATVAFSSIAGRFGNAGQADYAAANDLLCKLGSSLRTRRPETQGLVIDWTAWADIGMATRGSIPRMMDLAGIDMLPPEGGIPIVRRELEAGTRGEVVVAQRLGIMLDEWEEDGGFDSEALEVRLAGPMLARGRVLGVSLYDGLTIETTLDPAEQPFLYDHRIGGIPVLPGVMGIEAFAEAVRVMLPDSRIDSIEDVTFLAPFKFYREEPRSMRLHVLYCDGADGIVARCRLIGVRRLASRPEPQVTVHFTARVQLSEEPAEDYARRQPIAEGESRLTQDDIYQLFFHGPAYRVLDRAWRADGTTVGLMPSELPLHHLPEDEPLFAHPRLVELCLQTAGLAEMRATGRMGLPLHIDRLQLLRPAKTGRGRLLAAVEPSSKAGGFDAYVIDESGEVYVIVRGYRTIELPGVLEEERLEQLRAALN